MSITTFEKVQRIISLAMLLNPTETWRKITGSKPTVFIEFSGHVSWLRITINAMGWQTDEKPDYDVTIHLCEDPDEKLNSVIKTLTELYDEWKDKEVKAS